MWLLMKRSMPKTVWWYRFIVSTIGQLAFFISAYVLYHKQIMINTLLPGDTSFFHSLNLVLAVIIFGYIGILGIIVFVVPGARNHLTEE